MNAAALAIIFCVIYYITAILLCRGLRLNVRYMAVGGVLSAVTLILSCILIPLPTGSVITMGAAIPLMVLALIGDYRLAIVTGWITGLLCMILVPAWQPIHWAQIFAEHLVCFSCLGLAGVFGSDKKWKCICGCVLAMTVKLIAHIFAGAVFFAANAWDGWGAWAYSLSYNLSSGIPELVLFTVVVTLLPLQRLKSVWRNLMSH